MNYKFPSYIFAPSKVTVKTYRYCIILGFQGFKLSFSRRSDIEKLIGKEAEKLAWIFCVIDRLSVDKAVKKFHDALTNRNTDAKDLPIIRCRSRLELGNFPITFSSDEWLDFIELSLADWLLKKKILLNLILLQCQ
jgi:hypothetical protein